MFMKTCILILTLFTCTLCMAQYTTVTAEGAGDEIYNTDYTYESITNGKPKYDHMYDIGGGDLVVVYIAWSGSRWEMGAAGLISGTPLYMDSYFHVDDTPLPPATGWQVDVDGIAPPPTLSGDVTLQVTLSSFSAEVVNGQVLLKWITEAEVNNLGFILERISDGFDAWQTIASYQTHSELMGQGNASQRTIYTYTDETVQIGQSYSYRLGDVSTKGEIYIYDVIDIAMPEVPEQMVLDPPFPNPFNPQTRIMYQLSQSGPVEIIVYDLLGRKVRTLVDDFQSAGSYHVYWHGNDDLGRPAASGAYLVRMIAGETQQTHKVLLLR